MANDNSFGLGLNKIKSIVDRLFKLFDNFIDGYSVTQSKTTERQGGITNSMVITTDINGEKVDIRVDLTATNVGSVFKQYTNTINSLNYESLNVDKVKMLVGDAAINKLGNEGDISLASAIKRGANGGNEGGFLGVDLQKVAEGGFQSAGYEEWKDIAFEKLRYTLMCETADDDAGKVANQKLIDCAKWISKYTAFVESNHSKSEEVNESTQIDNEAIVAKQLSAEEKKSKAENTELIANVIVMPILIEIQAQLRELYQDKLNDDTSLDSIIDHDAESGDNDNNQDEGDQNDAGNPLDDQGNPSDDGSGNPNGGDDDLNSKNSSKHISITLKKIQASDELSILALNSNYQPSETLSDIDEIINQDDFISVLKEEPQSFTIEVDDEGFDIEPCEACECDPCASLCEVFKAAIRAYRNFYIIHWMSSGNDMMKLHILAEDMYSEMIQEIDTLGELLVEKQGTVPQLDFPCDYVPVQKYEFQGSLETIKSLVNMYLDCIDYAYPNQTSDVQSTLDEWLRYWNKQVNYFVKNQEE